MTATTPEFDAFAEAEAFATRDAATRAEYDRLWECADATMRELAECRSELERYEREEVPIHADANARMRAALGDSYGRLWGPPLESLGRQMDRVLHERDEAKRALAAEREIFAILAWSAVVICAGLILAKLLYWFLQ